MSTAYDTLLLILADAVDDLEGQRIATQNRLRSLAQIKGMSGSREERNMLAIFDRLKGLERQAIRDLENAVLNHPVFGPWVEINRGVGAKGIGRLLGAIGDPADRSNVAKLWQYCGHGDPERSRKRKGEQVQFSPRAKTALWNVSQSAYRQGTYRGFYLQARAEAVGKVHTRPCVNRIRPVAGRPAGSNGCGTQDHPEWGEPGSPWRDGHQHAHALRIVGKEILKDLWLASRDPRAIAAALAVA